MPEIVMSRQAVLPLKDSADKTSTLRPVQKKDRRKLRHQQWLQSIYAVCFRIRLHINMFLFVCRAGTPLGSTRS